MKRRHFMKAAGLLATVPMVEGIASVPPRTAGGKEIYDWRIYTLTTPEGNELDSFYKDTLIPAYNRQGINVGAFKLYEEKDAAQRFYFFIYPDIATFHKVKHAIWDDDAFRKAAQPFYDKAAVSPVYKEFESYLCEAFDKIPRLKMPDKDRTLFHLRHYRSPNEEANQRKVKMFNEAEMAIFDKVGIHPVCYGEVLSGPHLPSLMYLTWYKDKESHDASWKAFGSHPDWHAIKDLPAYAHTATDNTNRILLPLAYSQI
ncbi:MAG: NIPSNAP family protein [Tannerellaceae bacterium]|nr:NIPSNAP family protein [Tannerellaceae bacterium]